MKRIPLTIFGFVGAHLRRRLCSLLPTATLCADWRDVEVAIQRVDSSILFVDPMAVEGCAELALRLRERFPSVAVVVYTVLDPASIQHVVRLAQGGITEVVLCGFDDKQERIQRLLEDATNAATLCLEPIEPLLARLPEALRRSVEEMFRQPKRFRSTLDLAAAANLSVRAVFRYLKAAGVASPRRLVASARVLRAYQLLADSGRSGTDVAARLGYRNVDQLSQHLTELAGCTATDVKKGLAPSDLVSVVLRSVVAVKAAVVSGAEAVLAGAEWYAGD